MAKQTALYQIHKDLGAKLVEFAGYEMPIQYSGIIEEHKQVRNSVGVFDVSHMGEFLISGDDAESFLNYVTINNVAGMSVGQAQYNAMCYEDGGMIDDLLIYKFEDHYLMVVNAANLEKDWNWLEDHATDSVSLEDVSDSTTLLAVQGPNSRNLLQKLTESDLSKVKFYYFIEGKIDDVPATIARTGYTGELGFELYIDNKYATQIWNVIFDAGEEFDVLPVGLGARDTLRLESGFCLYGNDIDKTTNPLEAGLGWITKLDKGDFIGRGAVQKAKDNGLTRRLIGFELQERGIPRHGYTITKGGEEIGEVTSGSQSPMLGKGIGMGYVRWEYRKPGEEIAIQVRNKEIPAIVVKPPFHKQD